MEVYFAEEGKTSKKYSFRSVLPQIREKFGKHMYLRRMPHHVTKTK
jgi:hypothetical protein